MVEANRPAVSLTAPINRPTGLPAHPPQMTATLRATQPTVRILGTHGVPANYGGFETAIEEVGSRLAARGHEITVYCRRPSDGTAPLDEHLGMQLVHLPALRTKSLETLTHSAFSAVHAAVQRRVIAPGPLGAVGIVMSRHGRRPSPPARRRPFRRSE